MILKKHRRLEECGNISNINTVGVPKGNKEEKAAKAKSEEIMGENFPEFRKNSNPHIQETL